MRRFALAALSLAFLATACQPATTELTEEQKAEIATEVNAIQAEAWDAWRAADYDRGMSYFDSENLLFAYEGAMFGYAAADELWRPQFASIASQTITVEDSRTIVLAPNVVCIMQTGTYTVTDTAGVTTPEDSFAYTGIWMRHDGEWKVHMSHESMPTPEAESM
jgi:ketosteroid isomerase-like protein